MIKITINKKIKPSGIYRIQSKIKPERIYIGSAIDLEHRWVSHISDLRKNKHHNQILQNHVNKYGLEDLIFTIIEPCLSGLLLTREQFYIDALNPYFNICKTAGNILGVRRSKETRQRIGELKKGNKYNLGRICPIEKRRKISEANKGHIPWNKGRSDVYSDETKRKISESQIGEKNCNYGKHFSEETRQKMRLASIGKPKSEEAKLKMRKPKTEQAKQNMRKPKSLEHIEKIRKAMLGKKASPETRRKMSEKHSMKLKVA